MKIQTNTQYILARTLSLSIMLSGCFGYGAKQNNIPTNINQNNISSFSDNSIAAAPFYKQEMGKGNDEFSSNLNVITAQELLIGRDKVCGTFDLEKDLFDPQSNEHSHSSKLANLLEKDKLTTKPDIANKYNTSLNDNNCLIFHIENKNLITNNYFQLLSFDKKTIEILDLSGTSITLHYLMTNIIHSIKEGDYPKLKEIHIENLKELHEAAPKTYVRASKEDLDANKTQLEYSERISLEKYSATQTHLLQNLEIYSQSLNQNIEIYHNIEGLEKEYIFGKLKFIFHEIDEEIKK